MSPASNEHERVFEVFGTEVRLLIGPPLRAGLPAPGVMALELEGLMRAMHGRMTRFEPDSELSRLNSDPREEVEVSPLLMAGLHAALAAAKRTGGLVDPTLVGALEAAGYARSRRGAAPASVKRALADAPPRRPGRPAARSVWRSIELRPAEGRVRRPVGARVDLGGSAKGLAADRAAAELAGYAGFAVDVGGDLRVGGESTAPREVRILHPLGGEAARSGRFRTAHRFVLSTGAVATSGIATRVWAHGGGYAHHLIDPSRGEPAWTGLVQATALAPSAVEAEALAKAAFLSGPGDPARRLLGPHGGVLIADDGAVEVVGPPAEGAVPAPDAAAVAA